MISWYDKITLNVIHIFAFYLIKNFVGDTIICKIVSKKKIQIQLFIELLYFISQKSNK